MSDYARNMEIDRLYALAVQYGMVPPNWDGTPPGTLVSEGVVSADPPERHGEHRQQGRRS